MALGAAAPASAAERNLYAKNGFSINACKYNGGWTVRYILRNYNSTARYDVETRGKFNATAVIFGTVSGYTYSGPGTAVRTLPVLWPQGGDYTEYITYRTTPGGARQTTPLFTYSTRNLPSC